MRAGNADVPELIKDLNELSAQMGYTKIFAKISAESADPYINDGFVTEARARNLLRGESDCLFMGKFLSPRREHEHLDMQYEQVLKLSITAKDSNQEKRSLQGYSIRKCTENDADEMGRIYSEVYKTYPFPIDSPTYIAGTMKRNIDYCCIEHKGSIAALASMEIDSSNMCVEMSDFATLQQFRREGLATLLLLQLEENCIKRGIRSSFTIARSISPGINIMFSRQGYTYAGRLRNNTQISGEIESMNVWYKLLQ